MSLLKFFGINNRRNFFTLSLSVVLSVLVVAVTVNAATTISTNISTGGTLAVTGASTLTGDVTAGADLIVTSGARIGTGSSGGHITAVADDTLFVEGQSEFDGIAWFDAQLQASSTALFGGAVNTYGNSTFGDAGTDVNLFTGTLQASTTALFTGATTFYGNLTLDKAATTTLTFNQTGINFDSNTLVIDPNSNRVGIGTASPNTLLEIGGTSSTTSLIVGGDSTNGTVAGIVFGTCSVDLGSITASSTLSANCTGADGVRTADRVFITPRSLETHLVMTSASSTVADVIQVSVYNEGWGGAIDPAAATWDWMAIR